MTSSDLSAPEKIRLRSVQSRSPRKQFCPLVTVLVYSCSVQMSGVTRSFCKLLHMTSRILQASFHFKVLSVVRDELIDCDAEIVVLRYLASLLFSSTMSRYIVRQVRVLSSCVIRFEKCGVKKTEIFVALSTCTDDINRCAPSRLYYPSN